VSSAGAFLFKPVDKISKEEFDHMVAVDLKAAFIASRAALEHMPDGGRIVFISSNIADFAASATTSIYSMVKAGLDGLAKGMARDLGARGITVNTVHPGPIKTDGNPEDSPYARDLRSFMVTPDYGEPADVGAMVAFLVSFEAKFATAMQAALLSQQRLDLPDNLSARRLYTQVSVIRKIIITAVVIIATGSVLMLFDPVRQFGTSILASAGIAGIVIGFAAQRTLGNVLAGIQIALTQPLLIDDIVVVEGEFGQIEEITLTYVTVRTWDLRRMPDDPDKPSRRAMTTARGRQRNSANASR
jgi:small-conductance mechanosensitive channel